MGKIMYRGENFPGGPNLLSELRDVDFSNIQDKQIILYDSTSRTWKNHTITAADVAYDANNSVEDAIDTLNSALDNIEMINAGQLNFNNGVATYNYSKAKTTGRYMAQRSTSSVHAFLCTAKCLTDGVISVYAYDTSANGTPRQGTLSDIIIMADNR